MAIEGVVPSPEFNEQLKRVVRESIRQERHSQITKARWHKKSGGNVQFAKYVGCIGDGFHTVTLASRAPDDSRTASGTASGSGTGFDADCDPCTTYDGGASGECPEPAFPSIAGVVGDGATVIAYDPFRLPIEANGVVIVGKPIGNVDGDLIYPILNAEYELIAIKDSEYDCCDIDGSGAGTDTQVQEIRRRYYITVGCVTPWCDVDPCAV